MTSRRPAPLFVRARVEFVSSIGDHLLSSPLLPRPVTFRAVPPPPPQWGHDFRPEYCKLGILKRQFAHVPVLAVTATCTDFIRSDVSEESVAARVLTIFGNWCAASDDFFRSHRVYPGGVEGWGGAAVTLGVGVAVYVTCLSRSLLPAECFLFFGVCPAFRPLSKRPVTAATTRNGKAGVRFLGGAFSNYPLSDEHPRRSPLLDAWWFSS